MTTKAEPTPLAFAENADLIRRAEQWATGATIHNVKNLIGAYRSALGAIRQERHTNRHRLWMLVASEVYAAQLEAYMRHGDYRRARRENPLPPELVTADATPAELAEFHLWNLYAAENWLYDIGEADLAAALQPATIMAIKRSDS